MNSNNTEKAKFIISKIQYITIASISNDGKLLNTPVFSAYDQEYNFYWGSHRESQHSQNVRANSEVFLVIYDSTSPVAGVGDGVYVDVSVTELEDDAEIKFAYGLLSARHQTPYWKLEQVSGDAPIRLYRAKPKKFWINGEGEVNGTYIDTRVEIKLP